eukprot:gnl/MRDRNA2_/MRDRNA2_72998_c0_seq2.p1 gnl/MRDRNA2_/MRDRNA2_72998_c0~~gnl/MRDRNA2_/MRDRNA2_72998_c0_seq2.p1  ORF type:complete len:304 (-),score=60.75 gnl/MRDRNA2_/MRDRNA2_72998_c0_seq2:184-1095(-)
MLPSGCLSQLVPVVLVAWSPPSHLRGIPLNEFMAFLEALSEDTTDWDVPTKKNTAGTVRRKATERDMYDVCECIVKPKATLRDCSFAERFCSYGPAQLMISHVWMTKVSDTRDALNLLTESLENWQSIRVWFCTVCNNQCRVVEEIGTSIETSAFAQVLNSPYCESMVTLNPALALTRKWCTYEYSQALHVHKPVWLATTHGVLQSGDLKPSMIMELAEQVKNLKCANASCSNKEDAALIDEAVARRGGYSVMDAQLKRALCKAIAEQQEKLDAVKAKLLDKRMLSARDYGSIDSLQRDKGRI